ncbi:MAG: hypothetical protein ACP5C3_02335 [Methanomicrobiales archaeon]
MTTEQKVISGKYLTTRSLNVEIKNAVNENEKNINIEVTKPFDSVAVGLCCDADITLAGSPGDFAGAINDGAKIRIKGNTGRYVGNNMTSGEIIVEGSADDGVGFGTYDGTIVVHGNAGRGVGQLNKGGTIIIDGNIGDLSGLYMLSGDIIVTGNAGNDTGDWMIGGSIYVGGSFETGTNAEIRELTLDDKLKLKKLFDTYSIKADIENFKKIEHKQIRPFYGK